MGIFFQWSHFYVFIGIFIGTLLGMLVLVFFVVPRVCHAYLDWGTGSYLFQLAIAGLVGCLFILKTYWIRIMAFFRDLFSRKSEE